MPLSYLTLCSLPCECGRPAARQQELLAQMTSIKSTLGSMITPMKPSPPVTRTCLPDKPVMLCPSQEAEHSSLVCTCLAAPATRSSRHASTRRRKRMVSSCGRGQAVPIAAKMTRATFVRRVRLRTLTKPQPSQRDGTINGLDRTVQQRHSSGGAVFPRADAGRTRLCASRQV